MVEYHLSVTVGAGESRGSALVAISQMASDGEASCNRVACARS
jgi:hypothetical protein